MASMFIAVFYTSDVRLILFVMEPILLFTGASEQYARVRNGLSFDLSYRYPFCRSLCLG